MTTAQQHWPAEFDLIFGRFPDSFSMAMATAEQFDRVGPLSGKRVGFVGRLGGFNRKDAAQVVRQYGGTLSDAAGGNANLIVLGADELPWADEQLLDPCLQQAAAEGRLEVISETELWERLGLLDDEARERKYYTPAMLADLLHVPVTTIRRWHRRGLILPAREVHRLPYFDYQEVASARRLANMLAAGIPPAEIEKKLAALSQYVQGVERPLAQLSVIVEGRQILLRQEEGLLEPGGQLRFDFEVVEREAQQRGDSALASEPQQTLPRLPPQTIEQLLQSAEEYEAIGQLDASIENYRMALALEGPRADLCFQLAELLYRHGDTAAARERYYMAIELDETLVEARSNLGCVLAEAGEMELAIAAFQGALALHPDYADAHYQLARTLSEQGCRSDAEHHWREFLRLSPDSPWADEAHRWLHPEIEIDVECPK